MTDRILRLVRAYGPRRHDRRVNRISAVSSIKVAVWDVNRIGEVVDLVDWIAKNNNLRSEYQQMLLRVSDS